MSTVHFFIASSNFSEIKWLLYNYKSGSFAVKDNHVYTPGGAVYFIFLMDQPPFPFCKIEILNAPHGNLFFIVV